MKKYMYIICILLLMICVGCNNKKSAREVVSDYLDMYINNDKIVLEQLDELINKEELNDEQKELYKSAILREYKLIEYKILNERYEEDSVYVTVNIDVVNLSKVQRDAYNYCMKNKAEFSTDGNFDMDKYTTYKLERMNIAEDRISYDIVIKLDKDNDNYYVSQLSNEDLEKIHGIYDAY